MNSFQTITKVYYLLINCFLIPVNFGHVLIKNKKSDLINKFLLC